MIPRDEPFMGRVGIYNPAESWGINLDTRVVYDESIIDFPDYDHIYSFLLQSSDVMDWVYTEDGLVVGFGRAPQRQQINVYIYQLLLNGKKPQNLKGARPNFIWLVPIARPQT
jgi:hypothetical protein